MIDLPEDEREKWTAEVHKAGIRQYQEAVATYNKSATDMYHMLVHTMTDNS